MRFSACSRIALALVLVTLATPGQGRSQESRADLVERGAVAYLNLEMEEARTLFRSALNPVAEPPDSLWTVAVQYLTQLLLLTEEDELADVWMRWAVRLVPDMPVDSLMFLPEVITRYYEAVAFAGGVSPGDRLTEHTWEWPAEGDRAETGRLRVESATTSLALQARIVDQALLESGESTVLQPGSYQIEVVAQGYHGTTVVREVLPGVTTVVTFDLEPIVAPDALPPEVESTVLSSLTSFTVHRFRSEPTCGTGVHLGGGLVLTSYAAVRGGEGIEVRLADGRSVSQGTTVAAWEVESDLAILMLPLVPQDSLSLARELVPDQRVWVLRHPDCEAADVSTNRIVEIESRPEGRLELADSAPEGNQGGPAIDRAGAVVGVMVGASTAVPYRHADNLLVEAREHVLSGELLTLAEVARRQSHLYGSVLIQSSWSGAVADVKPLEAWHWEDAGAVGFVPLTFSGPMGKYQLELAAPGYTAHRVDFQVDPGLFKEMNEPQISAGKKFPWPLAAVGAAGAGVAAYFIFSGGDPERTTGGITITFPGG